MKKNLLILTCASCFFFMPSSQQLYGMDPANDQPMSVSVTQEKTSDMMVANDDLTKSVSDAIAQDKDTADFASVVVVKSDGTGSVILSGTVPSEKVKSDVEAKAKAVQGVTKVVNNLEVKDSTF